MMSGSVRGRRIFPDSAGRMWFKAGDYGQAASGEWMARPPFGASVGSLSDHEVVEHEDKTITVSPSIEGPGFHGYLERGMWRTA